jgi:UDP-N-acetylmuramoyl-L-alanyl-D-glutamate--2,6-diaminopimelate ligase
VAAIDFDVAVVTNITHEHLDYHGSWEAYLDAKAQLFRTLALETGNWPSSNAIKEQMVRTAVVNGDDVSFAYLRELPVGRRLVYRMGQPADVYATDAHHGPDATRFTLRISSGENNTVAGEIVSPLVGDFNIYNMLAASTAAHGLGLSMPEIQRGLQRCQPLTGRMQRIAGGQPFLVIVDFAHTPNALAEAIRAGRRMVSGRVITLFGSAGKRDVQKRRLMAEISARESDLTILTAEDPRTESLHGILEMMATGCRDMGGIEGQSFWRVPDRGRAIYFALQLARPDDLVLICGKGHEQSMCFGVTEYAWDDAVATFAALEALQMGKPMPDLGLPTFRLPN